MGAVGLCHVASGVAVVSGTVGLGRTAVEVLRRGLAPAQRKGERVASRRTRNAASRAPDKCFLRFVD